MNTCDRERLRINKWTAVSEVLHDRETMHKEGRGERRRMRVEREPFRRSSHPALGYREEDASILSICNVWYFLRVWGCGEGIVVFGNVSLHYWLRTLKRLARLASAIRFVLNGAGLWFIRLKNICSAKWLISRERELCYVYVHNLCTLNQMDAPSSYHYAKTENRLLLLQLLYTLNVTNALKQICIDNPLSKSLTLYAVCLNSTIWKM